MKGPGKSCMLRIEQVSSGCLGWDALAYEEPE